MLGLKPGDAVFGRLISNRTAAWYVVVRLAATVREGFTYFWGRRATVAGMSREPDLLGFENGAIQRVVRRRSA